MNFEILYEDNIKIMDPFRNTGFALAVLLFSKPLCVKALASSIIYDGGWVYGVLKNPTSSNLA